MVVLAVGAAVLSNHFGWFSEEKAKSAYNSGVDLQNDSILGALLLTRGAMRLLVPENHAMRPRQDYRQ